MDIQEIMNLKDKIRHQIQYQVDEFVQKTGFTIHEIELSTFDAETGGENDPFEKSNHTRSIVNLIIKL